MFSRAATRNPLRSCRRCAAASGGPHRRPASRKHLIGPDATVTCAEGRLRREAGGKETNFQAWVEQNVVADPVAH